MGFVAYQIDPFMYYRISNENKLLNARFVNMGIVKHYDYDTAFIGSSMIQNFDMQFFRDNSAMKPVKLVVGGMTLNEILMMYNLSQEYAHADQYIINVDLNQFDTSDPLDETTKKFPNYLYNESKIDDIKYLLGYETWVKYIPVNFAINTVKKLGKPLPQKFQNEVKIDKIEDWSLNYSFGKEIVKKNFIEKKFLVSELNKNGMYQRMKNNIDTYLSKIMVNRKKNQAIIFGFPPYSALYWHKNIQYETFEPLMDVKEYFILQALKYENVRIVDLQSIEEISDLDFYKDTTHFNLDIQEKYAQALISDDYDIDASDILDKRLQLSSLVNQFSNENSDWLE